MPLLLLLANAFFIGLAHALEPDHVAAVSTFITRHRGRREALRFSLRWGVGHMLPILFLALGALALGYAIPPSLESYAEQLVGAVLLLLGVWVLWEVWQKRMHFHMHRHGGTPHVHLHSHAHGDSHDHAHAAFGVGVVHGLAGSASALALVPISMHSSAWFAAAYVLTFSCGVIVSMALYGVSANAVIQRAENRRQVYAPIAQAIAGCCSLCLGLVWLLG